MSYSKKIEYEIVPKETFSVIRNCPGCSRKTHFQNTKKFRVNANGSRLDVWLIYQCENCKHTFNLTVYERQKATSIPQKEYERFLSNNEQLADAYGKNLQFFKKNKAEVDLQNVEYVFQKLAENITDCRHDPQTYIIIHNPWGLKLRPEKQMAEILALSRSKVKKMLEQGELKMDAVSSQLISFYVPNHFTGQS